MRVFVSIDLSESFTGPIADLQKDFQGATGLDFVDPEQAHVTMKFLGDIDPGRVDDIADALDRAVAEADVDPFEATFEGLGVFPSIEYINVLWLGVGKGTDSLVDLQAPIEDQLVGLGFDAEDHEFTPHVTLARMKHAGGKELVQERVRTTDPTVGTMTVDEVRLKESTLTDDGPEYETVHGVSL
ncbi:RNA 2',3'-cyclic phosphodiesterase [Halodesulfurarchaeum sp.]|uniref:RNA 2',3'-cyclic phosphodiesterase n=1 Tax=Halodesulfurarchaeum sp. TaxID=1980530 RepID=UPI001BB8B51A|nr:RNA 2',3'-cyclic phosphodiesterase [Halodesulfurarchaeum sp.]